LAPGIGIKRWGALIAAGVLVFGPGFALLINERFLTQFEAAIFRLAQSLGRVTGYEASPMALGVLGVTLGVLAT